MSQFGKCLPYMPDFSNAMIGDLFSKDRYYCIVKGMAGGGGMASIKQTINYKPLSLDPHKQ